MDKIKYFRTKHLPFSLGRGDDDKVLDSTEHFLGKEIVVTEKMDGENSTLATEYCHARSVDSKHHPSREWIKAFHSRIRHEIPEMWRVCGENMFAKHSIFYDNLKSYFYGFSLWNEHNVALSWDDTIEWFNLIGIEPVPVLWRGIFDEEVLKKLASDMDFEKQEGFVIRLAGEFRYEDADISIAKFVRPRHVQTTQHWMHSRIIPNQLLINA